MGTKKIITDNDLRAILENDPFHSQLEDDTDPFGDEPNYHDNRLNDDDAWELEEPTVRVTVAERGWFV